MQLLHTGARAAGQVPHQLDSALCRSRSTFIFPLLRQLLIGLSLLFIPPFCYAQDEEVGPGDIVRIETDLIPIEVTVRNAAGQTVRGLRSSDFKIFEDEIEQPISFFSAEATSGGVQCPFDLVFALDVSGSMTRNEMLMLRDAAAVFKELLSGQRARFAVISFGMRVRLLQSFTGDERKLDKAFAAAAQDEMGLSTHAYDAVDDAVRLLSRQGRKTSGGQVVKRAVIIISDGFPTGDIVSPRTVIERANAANVSVYSITMPSFSFDYAGYGKPLPTLLDISGLIERTGGVNVYVTDKNYAAAFKALSEEVLARYVLAFYPGKEKQRDGNFHKLRIVAPDGLTISQSRQGYGGNSLR